MAPNGKFVIKQGRGGKIHFVLLASNGRVVATSETDESKESCLKGIAAVKGLAADASVIEDDATPVTTETKRSATARRTTNMERSSRIDAHGQSTLRPRSRALSGQAAHGW